MHRICLRLMKFRNMQSPRLPAVLAPELPQVWQAQQHDKRWVQSTVLSLMTCDPCHVLVTIVLPAKQPNPCTIAD